jgi:hypothetical protein
MYASTGLTMADGGIIDASAGVADSIGRYFSVVSFIPSSLYIVFVYLLVASGGWHHPPDWSHAIASLAHLGVEGVVLLTFLSIGLGIFIHPIQFAIVQFFEGYWGTWTIPQAIRHRRILHYQALCDQLNQEKVRAVETLDRWEAKPEITHGMRAPIRSRRDEADRVRSKFPKDFDEFMPTRLGNVLRRAETLAGSQYGIDALQAVPHLLLIAPPNHVDYVNDQRSQLDLAVRMTFLSAMAALTAIIFLCRDGAWVLIALIPYVLAYFSYRGSVVAAGHYGSALETLITLNRFALYEQLHAELPDSTQKEKETNTKIRRLLEYRSRAAMDYKHPSVAEENKSKSAVQTAPGG